MAYLDDEVRHVTFEEAYEQWMAVEKKLEREMVKARKEAEEQARLKAQAESSAAEQGRRVARERKAIREGEREVARGGKREPKTSVSMSQSVSANKSRGNSERGGHPVAEDVHSRRLRILEEGLQYAERLFAERVWWQAFRGFDRLRPQYEIRDFRDGHRYIDFAYLHPDFRIAIEIDGASTHWTNIAQQQFSDHLRRQNDLVIDEWNVLRFSEEDVKLRSRECQKTVQQLIGRLTAVVRRDFHGVAPTDREILRVVFGKGDPITVTEVALRVGMERHAVARRLKRLVDEGWLDPVGANERVRRYQVSEKHVNFRL